MSAVKTVKYNNGKMNAILVRKKNATKTRGTLDYEEGDTKVKDSKEWKAQ